MRLAMVNKTKDELFSDKAFHNIMVLMLKDCTELISKIALFKVKKMSTRMEIYRRLTRAREHIDFHVGDDLNLIKLGKEAAILIISVIIRHKSLRNFH